MSEGKRTIRDLENRGNKSRPYENRAYGFYSQTGAHELRNFQAGELVNEATIKRFNIPEKFLEPKEKKFRSKK